MHHTLVDLQRIADIQFSDIVLTTFMIENNHFHRGTQNALEVPPFPLTILEGFISFMEFVRSEIELKSLKGKVEGSQ